MSKANQAKLYLPGDSLVERVEEYQFEPIKGYPMLSWRGKRPFTSTYYYPAQLREVHGSAVKEWQNKIYWGDNLQVMSHLLKVFRGKVNLIYIDPPFDSKADYKMNILLKGKAIQTDTSTFEEKQYTDIWTNDEYLQFMYERLVLMRELLSESGSIYLHCDYRKHHHLRCIMDEVFGAQNIANEIIWCYTRPSRVTDYFPRVHDDILFYSKSNNRTFNTDRIRIPYDDETVARSNRGAGEQSVMGAAEGVERLREGGKIPEDYWDIPILQGNALERVAYPTQKPERLIERIILTSSNPGEIVFDCFMGSGTTQAVAMKLGRRFIGADINLGAVQVTTKRLLGVAEGLDTGGNQSELFSEENNGTPTTYYTGFEIYNVNNYELFRNPAEARDLLLEALEVNRLPQGHLFDGEKDGRMIKIMPVNRITTRAELGELIAGLDLKLFEKRHKNNPNEPVEKITLVCMGHEPDLKASLEKELEPYKLDVEVVDILRDRQDLEFKHDSEIKVVISKGKLVIERFYPMNLLNKLSLKKGKLKDWRELVESVMIDWNFDGAVLTPTIVDIPEKEELVRGSYPIPKDAGMIRIKITDLLSESLEVEIAHG